jgi:hypothetical protein
LLPREKPCSHHPPQSSSLHRFRANKCTAALERLLMLSVASLGSTHGFAASCKSTICAATSLKTSDYLVASSTKIFISLEASHKHLAQEGLQKVLETLEKNWLRAALAPWWDAPPSFLAHHSLSQIYISAAIPSAINTTGTPGREFQPDNKASELTLECLMHSLGLWISGLGVYGSTTQHFTPRFPL